MKSMYDIQQLLKRYGIFIYTGDRDGDLQLMEMEIDDLYQSHLLDAKQYTKVKMLLKQEMSRNRNIKDDGNE